MSDNSLKVTDNRTGRNYQIEIEDGAVRALDFRKIKLNDDDFGLITYDPVSYTHLTLPTILLV